MGMTDETERNDTATRRTLAVERWFVADEDLLRTCDTPRIEVS